MKLSELSEIRLLDKIRNVNTWLLYFALFYRENFYAQDTLPESNANYNYILVQFW